MPVRSVDRTVDRTSEVREFPPTPDGLVLRVVARALREDEWLGGVQDGAEERMVRAVMEFTCPGCGGLMHEYRREVPHFDRYTGTVSPVPMLVQFRGCDGCGTRFDVEALREAKLRWEMSRWRGEPDDAPDPLPDDLLR